MRRLVLTALLVVGIPLALTVAQEGAQPPAPEQQQPAAPPQESPPAAEEEAPEQEPAGQPAQEPAEEPAEEPGEQPADEPAGQPADEPAAEPAEEPAGQPADEPAGEVAGGAQGAAAGAVNLDEASAWGEFLVDSEGRSLYIYTEDEQGAGTSACYDRCAENWPPFTADGELTAGEGVDESLLGTIERDDGTTQVTYDGWPLYYSARDTESGHTRGQMIGNAFFLIGGTGEAVTEEMAQAGADVTEEELEELMATGQQAYAANCQVCHGDQGQGGIGPALANNSLVGDNTFLIERIIEGFPDHGMPPFGHLSDEQIAAISTYVRNSWGNEFGAVVPEEVEEHR